MRPVLIAIGILLFLIVVYLLLIKIVMKTAYVEHDVAKKNVDTFLKHCLCRLWKFLKKFFCWIYQLIKKFIDFISVQNKQQFFLHNSQFSTDFQNEIACLLPQADFEAWFKRFYMRSKKMQIWGFNSGLPFYAVNLFVPNENIKKDYEEIIRNLAYDALSDALCFPEVLIDWKNPENSYCWVEIRYARTEEETEILVNQIKRNDNKNCGTGNDDTIKDEEMNKQIEKLKKIIEERKQNGY